MCIHLCTPLLSRIVKECAKNWIVALVIDVFVLVASNDGTLPDVCVLASVAVGHPIQDMSHQYDIASHR